MTDQTAWERTPQETSKAFEAFTCYIALPAGERSISKAAAQYYGKPTASIRQLEKWSAANNWVARAAAYDAHMLAQVQESREDAARQIVEDELTDYDTMLTQWRKVWEQTPAFMKTRDQMVTDANGERVRMVTTAIDSADFVRLMRWRREIDDFGRRALGLPDKITSSELKGTGKDGEILTRDLSGLSDDELQRVLHGD